MKFIHMMCINVFHLQVLRACDEIAPDALTDLAILKLIHPHVKRLELHNLHIKSEKVQKMGSLLDLIFKKFVLQ